MEGAAALVALETIDDDATGEAAEFGDADFDAGGAVDLAVKIAP